MTRDQMPPERDDPMGGFETGLLSELRAVVATQASGRGSSITPSAEPSHAARCGGRRGRPDRRRWRGGRDGRVHHTGLPGGVDRRGDVRRSCVAHRREHRGDFGETTLLRSRPVGGCGGRGPWLRRRPRPAPCIPHGVRAGNERGRSFPGRARHLREPRPPGIPGRCGRSREPRRPAPTHFEGPRAVWPELHVAERGTNRDLPRSSPRGVRGLEGRRRPSGSAALVVPPTPSTRRSGGCSSCRARNSRASVADDRVGGDQPDEHTQEQQPHDERGHGGADEADGDTPEYPGRAPDAEHPGHPQT